MNSLLIHMKCQGLFSLKDNQKTECPAAILLGALKVKLPANQIRTFLYHQDSEILFQLSPIKVFFGGVLFCFSFIYFFRILQFCICIQRKRILLNSPCQVAKHL